MTAPPKPWEMTSNFRMSNISEPRNFISGAPNVSSYSNARGITTNSAPPLPPRPYSSHGNYGSSMGGYGNYGSGGYGGYGGLGGSYGGYGSYTGLGGGYGMGNYGGYGGYSGYGSNLGYAGYGGGYGGMYGAGYGRGPNNLESRFIQLAEQSSRPAFQSIESVVGAFGGIAAMLDSTFMAMTSSFNAILGVAENFGRLRTLFAQFWSTFAIIRSINWLFRKLMSLLGLSKYDPLKAQAWADALNSQNSQDDTKRQSNWPILMFLGIVVSAPYIIIKLLGGLNKNINELTSDPNTWKNPLLAAAVYDFQSANPGELQLRAMQSVRVAPLEVQNQMQLTNTGWLLATTDNKSSGLVPANYIKVIKGNATFIPNSTVPTTYDNGNNLQNSPNNTPAQLSYSHANIDPNFESQHESITPEISKLDNSVEPVPQTEA